MSEVLIDDSSLNAIAHSIRRKNGLLRTYKPREMAPAIRAFNDFVPDAHSFTINVQQSPHQTIRLRKYLDADYKEYTNTFTVSEPFYKADIIVEADAGYEAGKPNYVSPITIDRDMVISASPATPSMPEKTTIVYFNGTRRTSWGGTHVFYLYSDASCTQKLVKDNLTGKIIVMDVSNGYNVEPYDYSGLFGSSGDDGYRERCTYVKEIVSYVNVSEGTSLDSAFMQCRSMRKVDLSNFLTGNCQYFSNMFYGCSALESVDITNFDFSEARGINGIFSACSNLESIVFPTCSSPHLTEIKQLFEGCSRLRVIDISGLDTSNVSRADYEFRDNNSLRYVILDYPEIRLHHELWRTPNTTKILVPSNLLSQYKETYSDISGRFYNIDNYTITRYGGQVFVTPNN